MDEKIGPEAVGCVVAAAAAPDGDVVVVVVVVAGVAAAAAGAWTPFCLRLFSCRHALVGEIFQIFERIAIAAAHGE